MFDYVVKDETKNNVYKILYNYQSYQSFHLDFKHMNESNEVEGEVQGGEEEEDADGEDDESEGLVMGGGTGTDTPARKEETWLA